MAAITTETIKELRGKTGAGVMDCRRALEQAGGDLDKAVQILHTQGLERAEKKSGRVARQGVVDAYVHLGRIGVLVELNCETDFVARDEGFRALAHELAMQVAFGAPEFVAPEDAPADMPEDEKRQKVLLLQPFIQNESQTVLQRIIERAARFGENVRVRRFVRFEVGVEG
ncbi:MAG TPA: translation elongation factor Ts [Chloroflexota bacterium]|jgi:elongation factor Ts|nr:translation elongation factor Ts [Chloroflexota bacterium]